MKETKEQIIYDLQICKGYMRMPRDIQKHKQLTATAKELVAMIFSFSNTKVENSSCTRTYAEFSKNLNISCATVSRSIKQIKLLFPDNLKQTRRATWIFTKDNLKSYIIFEYYFILHPFLFPDNTKRFISRFAAQAAAILYESFIKDSKTRDWQNDKRQEFAIHSPWTVSALAEKLGCSEKSAAKAISELISCGIIYLKGKYKQLNGYFCRDFKPCLKLFEAIHEVRTKKSTDLEKARHDATEAEKQYETEREEKIAAARKKHADRYSPLFDRQKQFIKMLFNGKELTNEEQDEWNEIGQKIARLDEFYINSG